MTGHWQRGGGDRDRIEDGGADENSPLLGPPRPEGRRPPVLVVPGSTNHLLPEDDAEVSSDESVTVPTPATTTTDAEESLDEDDGDILRRITGLTAVPVLEPEIEPPMLLPRHQRAAHHHKHDFPPATSSSASEGPRTSSTTPLLADDNGEEEEEEGEEISPTKGTQKTTPYLAGLSPARVHAIFALVLLVYFAACFDGTVMASSHPAVTSHFGAAHSASWLSTAFLLASAAVQPLMGRLSDAAGRKVPYVAAIAVFSAGTAACALAPTMAAFVAARAVCGLGAGGMMSIGGIMVSDMVPVERRGTFQSMFNVVYGIGMALGAALGGLMADNLGWRWEFGVQVFPLLVALVAAILVIPGDLGKQHADEGVWEALRAFDFRGSALLTTSVTCFVLGMNLGGNVLPWNHPLVIASLCLVAVSFPAFLYSQSVATRPIMPLWLLSTSPHANLIFANFIGAVIANAILFNVPLFFQAVLLTSATTSGLYLIVPTVAASITGTSTGLLITLTRRLKWPLQLGTLCLLAGTVLLSRLRRDLPSPSYYLLALVPAAVGQGFQFPGTVMALLASSPQRDQAVVSSALILWRSLGSVLGVAASSLVLQASLARRLDRLVRGPERDRVIEQVRGSVEAVAGLEEPYRGMVVRSYEGALSVTFLACAGAAVVSVVLIWPVRLARLKPHRK